MARRRYSRPLALDLFRPLTRDGSALLSDQIADRVGGMVSEGTLPVGGYLPPLRLLAQKLGVTVGTVRKACDRLRNDGVLASDSTRGLRIAGPGRVLAQADRRPWAGPVLQPALPRDPLRVDLPRPTGEHLVRFHVSEPGADLLPRDLIESSLATAVRDRDVLRYAPLDGLPELRAALQQYLRQRGVALAESALLVTTGTAQGLAVVTRALLPPGGVVLTEHPTWHVALSIFAAAGAKVVALPVDDEGLDVETLPEVVLRHNPSFLYLQPAFQNPTGTTLSARRRTALLAMARKFQLPIVEDDYAGDLAFIDPVPPLRNGDGAESVIYLKSFAKLIAPAFRVGVMVAPARYGAIFNSVRNGLDPFASAITQRALVECLQSERFDGHLRVLSLALYDRWQVMHAALRRFVPRQVRWSTPLGGLCAWMELPARAAPDEFLAEAARHGVTLSPGRLFCLDESGHRGFRLAFAATTPEEIGRGIEVLGGLLDTPARARRPRDAAFRDIAP
jgi:2-aminoadipate transaminase